MGKRKSGGSWIKLPLTFLRSGLVEHLMACIAHLRQTNANVDPLHRLLVVLAEEINLSATAPSRLALPHDSRLRKLGESFQSGFGYPQDASSAYLSNLLPRVYWCDETIRPCRHSGRQN
jgi:hypothetical protein